MAQHDGANPGLPPSPKRAGCVLSVACGSHTHFLAAETPAAARAWVDAITEAWTQCVKHTARGGHVAGDAEVAAFREAAWRAEASAQRASLTEARANARERDGEYWQRVTEAQAKLQALEAAQAAGDGEDTATYEIQVVTGDACGAGTSSAVFLELTGDGDARSGEYRLLYKDPARVAFQVCVLVAGPHVQVAYLPAI